MSTRTKEDAVRQARPGTGQIATHIRALEDDFRAEDRAYLRRKLARRLEKFADSIERVSLRTEDVNGPRGGIDRVCRVKVVLRGLPTVVIEKRDAALNAAVALALDGVERAVRRRLQRRRMKPLRRTSVAKRPVAS
jgi:ribosome-associated translation inhibitor RaiA